MQAAMQGCILGDALFLAALVVWATGCLLYSIKTTPEKEFFKMNRVFQQTLNLGPALAANHSFSFKSPFDCQLVHVSLCNSTANAGTLKIGIPADDDYYLAAKSFGVSGAPAEAATPAGFDGVGAGGQYPHVESGATLLVTITDHASHMANAAVVLTFTEG